MNRTLEKAERERGKWLTVSGTPEFFLSNAHDICKQWTIFQRQIKYTVPWTFNLYLNFYNLWRKPDIFLFLKKIWLYSLRSFSFSNCETLSKLWLNQYHKYWLCLLGPYKQGIVPKISTFWLMVHFTICVSFVLSEDQVH